MYKKNLLRLALSIVGLWIDCHGTVKTVLDQYNQLMYNPSTGIFSISDGDQGGGSDLSIGGGYYFAPSNSYNPSKPGKGNLAYQFGLKTREAFSNGNNTGDTILVELPVGTRFIITDGDLAPTGTFTTTEIAYAVLLATGLSGTTQISNGVIHFTGGAFTGTYNYLGTDYPGGQLALPIEGFYATGTLVNPTLFQAAGSPTGEIPTGFTVNVYLDAPAGLTGEFTMQGGSYDTKQFIASSPIQVSVGVNGKINADGTLFTGNSIQLEALQCFNGTIDGTGGYITINTPPESIINFGISGNAAAGYNSLIFNGIAFAAGEYVVVSDDFQVGSCPP